MSYFENFPIVNYNGYDVRNIISRAKLTKDAINNKTAFYPYTMSEGDRADILSDKYYDSVDFMWLVWFSNNVIDPYYDLNISEIDFNQLIVKKYGSVETARRKIAFYRNDWTSSQTEIGTNVYEALPAYNKKYYSPVLDVDMNISSYSRKRRDWVVNTNKIISCVLSGVTGSFTIGEEVKVDDSNYGFVTYSSGTDLSLNNITGTFNISDVLLGQESSTSATIVSSTVVIENIPNDEASFWTSVSCYDYEVEQNELKKEIRLVDNRYKHNAESDLARVMNQ